MKARPILLAVMSILALCGPAWAVDGMVSYWKFDQGSGTTAYDFFGDNHGTVYGAQWIDGQVEGALTFDGVDDYVDIPYDSSLDINASQGISITVWLKLNSYPSGWNQGPIFGLFDSADAGSKNYLFIDKPLYGNLITWDQYPSSYGWIKSIKPDLDTWYHIVVVEDSTYRAIYLNGSLDISDDISESYQGNTPDTIRIGNRADLAPFYFDGSIDEVAIYNKALLTEEIEQLYENSSAGYGYPVDTKILAINRIERAIAEKLDALDKVNAALEKEWTAYEALQELLESRDYGDLTKANIIRAGQEIHSAIQHEELSKKTLDRSIEKLEDALAALGWQPPPPMPQPVFHFKFDEGSGTIAYDSVGTNDGTVHGATWTTGQINGALSFDGVDDYVNVIDSDNSLDIEDNITITTWVKLDYFNTHDHDFFVGKQPTGTSRTNYPGNYIFRTTPSNGYIHFHHQNGTGDHEISKYSSTFGIGLGAWRHVSVTLVEGGNVNFYIDGSPAGTVPQEGVFGLINDEPVRIGTRKDEWSYFNGLLDDIMIFDIVLSAQEIQQLYNNGSAGL